ncbi:MAG TPA: tRNA (adenosine(37)-N6)-threonylcarbamoyltransferase complex ATPase subunit type 1 TsaE [Chloroflexota bacterium]|nr:tRNA (adenosine(37)-N6)-threonylcarbamoyltransferase complex ATPase subunit type 1 TsaE [Chloroflexota bacterium]
MLRLISESPAQTVAIGRQLGQAARAGDVLLLEGPFGAGKTHLVQGLAEGLGIAATVTSPSFILAQEYRGRLPLYHLDLFRLERLDPATEEALAEYFAGDGVCAVEWPALLPAAWRQGAATIALRHLGEQARELVVAAAPAHLCEALRRAARL